MVVKWVPLSLSALYEVAGQIKDVAELFKDLDAEADAGNAEAAVERDLLRTAIVGRVEELQDFYFEHDLDDRAILFEKERLRLRRAIGLDEGSIHSYASSAAGVSLLHDSAAAPSPGGRLGETAEASSLSARLQARAGDTSVASSRNASANGRRRRPAPIYEWEKTSQQLDASLSTLRTPHAGSSAAGGAGRSYYSSSAGGTSMTGSTLSDIKIKLSREEFEELQRRKMARSLSASSGASTSRTGSANRTQTSRSGGARGTQPSRKRWEVSNKVEYLNSAQPYVDSYRGTAAKREQDRNKWVDKRGFRVPTSKEEVQKEMRRTGASLDYEYLNAGVVYVDPDTHFSKTLRSSPGKKPVADKPFRVAGGGLGGGIDKAVSIGAAPVQRPNVS